MAEILLKPEAAGQWDAGDIVAAFNDRRIRQCHAERICHPWKAGTTDDGLRPSGTHIEDFFRLTHQYKFERVSETEIKRIDQWTGDETILSDEPNADGERIDVPLFLRKRKAAKAPDGGPKLALFGSDGVEFWYGGRKDYSHTRLDDVWASIEANTDNLESDFPYWPLTDTELKRFLVFPVDDFDDATAAELIAPKMDDSTDPPTRVEKRKHYVDWRALFPIEIPPETPADDVTDKTVKVDPRPRDAGPLSRSSIVLTK